MKLNLGAGRKPLEGYSNIDLHIPSDVKFKAFDYIKDDVTILSEIEDESCSEIIAYHLLEHIPRLKVDMTLYLWYSKLKDNGKLILELPDMVKCCINFLSSETIDDAFTTERLGLIGIFGEVLKEDDHMQHLWGYSFKSLHKILTKVGFKEVIREEQQTKPEWSTKRDMRIVAIK